MATDFNDIYEVKEDEHVYERDYKIKMTEAQETGYYNEWD